MLELQRHAGNRAVAAMVKRAASHTPARPESRSRALIGSSAPLSIQRNIGLEIEIGQASQQRGMAIAPHKGCPFEKRDVIATRGTWDVTLDDTPGTGKFDRSGGIWQTPADGPYRKFHLEFNLHGGGTKHGFADSDAAGLLEALKEIEASFAGHGGETTVEHESKGEIVVFYPNTVPATVNIQLTAGTSLAGLQAALEGNFDMRGAAQGAHARANPLLSLAAGQPRKDLSAGFVSTDEISRWAPLAAKNAGYAEAPVLDELALKALPRCSP